MGFLWSLARGRPSTADASHGRKRCSGCHFPQGEEGSLDSLRGSTPCRTPAKLLPASLPPSELPARMRTNGLFQHFLLLLFPGLGMAGVLMEPKLSIPTAIELGNGAMAVCEVPNPPDSESLLIIMHLQGIKLGTTQRRQGDKEIAEATISPTEPGEYVVECSASTEKDTKKALANVTVYNLPQPLLSTKEDMEDMDEEENPRLTITCEVPPASATIISLDLTGAELPLSCKGDVTSVPRTCTLYSRKEYNGKEVTCQARMAVMGTVMLKTAAKKLNIEYAPEFSEGGCPTNQTLTEGNTNVILCRAEGNPLPDVTCLKGGNSYDAGMLPRVTRNHTGQYKCIAHNKADTSVRSITVSVQAAPPTSVKPPTPTTRPSNKGARSAAAMSTLALLLIHLY